MMRSNVIRVVILFVLLCGFAGAVYYVALPALQANYEINHPKMPPPGAKKGPRKGRRPKNADRKTTGTLTQTTGTLARTTGTLTLNSASTATLPVKSADKKLSATRSK